MAKWVRIGDSAFDLDRIVAVDGTRVVFTDGHTMIVSKKKAEGLAAMLGGSPAPDAAKTLAGPFGGLKALPKLGKDGVLVRLTGPAEMCDAVGTLLKAVFAELGYRAGETKELAPKALPSPSTAPKAPEKPKKVRSLRSRGAPKKAK